MWPVRHGRPREGLARDATAFMRSRRGRMALSKYLGHTVVVCTKTIERNLDRCSRSRAANPERFSFLQATDARDTNTFART